MEYQNVENGASKSSFAIHYYYNIVRTWFLFHFKYPWVKYHGFVRVMKGVSFAKMQIELGNNVQFGQYCDIAADCRIGNNVLLSGFVRLVGKYDHTFNVPGQTIWAGPRGDSGTTVIEDDVWVGNGSVLVGGLTLGAGSIIAAGSVVTQSVPPCEIWGGVPARKIKDRFLTEEDKLKHLDSLKK